MNCSKNYPSTLKKRPGTQDIPLETTIYHATENSVKKGILAKERIVFDFFFYLQGRKRLANFCTFSVV